MRIWKLYFIALKNEYQNTSIDPLKEIEASYIKDQKVYSTPVTITNWISSHFRLFFQIKTEEIPIFLLAVKKKKAI